MEIERKNNNHLIILFFNLCISGGLIDAIACPNHSYLFSWFHLLWPLNERSLFPQQPKPADFWGRFTNECALQVCHAVLVSKASTELIDEWAYEHDNWSVHHSTATSHNKRLHLSIAGEDYTTDRLKDK